MSANQMEYFEQKPELDLSSFFECKGIKLDKAGPVSGAAPPPKDTAWVAVPVPDTPKDGDTE